ncbi:hypothetical protein [Burkholderia sp. PU8-34]
MKIVIGFGTRRVFVFGGTSGINLGIAAAFARNGASIGVKPAIERAGAHAAGRR